MTSIKKTTQGVKDEKKNILTEASESILTEASDHIVIGEPTETVPSSIAPISLEPVTEEPENILDPVSPKTSVIGMNRWLTDFYHRIDACEATAVNVKTYNTVFDQEITIAVTKLSVAKDLIGKCLLANQGVIPESKITK